MINQKLLSKAYRLLARRDHSKLELQEKLLKKGFELKEVEEAIKHLEELGYLDDELFAKKYVEYKSITSPRGHYKLGMELKQKGVNIEYIKKALSSDKYNEGLLAEDLIQRKSRLLMRLSSDERQKKLWRLLKNRGFSAETIYKVAKAC